MRVLVGCEESAKVRDAMRKRDIDAWSCDLLPSRGLALYHIQMDVRRALVERGPWDVIILFPDCTAMCCSGNRWYGRGMPLHHKRIEAVAWTINLWEEAKKFATIGCAMENPKGVIWTALGVVPQYIHPHQFGHGETKETGILTHNLPRLVPTNNVEGREQRIWKMGPSPTRKRDRSETYQGVADAMAEQWGYQAIMRNWIECPVSHCQSKMHCVFPGECESRDRLLPQFLKNIQDTRALEKEWPR